jgi:heptosyltransferase-2
LIGGSESQPPAEIAPGGTLVVQTAFLGDVVLTTPLLAALARRFGPVDVLVRPVAEPLVETLPSVREALTYDKRGREAGLAGWRRMASRLARRRYARAFLPHRSTRSGLLAWWAGIPERIGFADAGGRWFYTTRVPRPTDRHEAERLLALAGSTADAAPIHLAITEDDRAAAYAWLASHGIGDGFVALAPGSVWATKRWTAFPELIKLLKGRVVVLGGPEDQAIAQTLIDAAPDRVASAVGELPLRVSAAVLERAGVVVTNDSAPLHLASATGTPTVAIFGPTVPAFGFGPRAPRAAIVERTDLVCRPCSPHGPERCPLGHHRCMREIPATAVRDAIHQLVG